MAELDHVEPLAVWVVLQAEGDQVDVVVIRILRYHWPPP